MKVKTGFLLIIFILLSTIHFDIGNGLIKECYCNSEQNFQELSLEYQKQFSDEFQYDEFINSPTSLQLLSVENPFYYFLEEKLYAFDFFLNLFKPPIFS